MKATVFSKAAIMMAVVIASAMNFKVNAATLDNFVQNVETTGKQVIAKTIFRNVNDYLFHHLHYTYTYDAENRITCQEAARWNRLAKAWEPYFKLDVEYVGNEVFLTYARWNEKQRAYDRPVEKIIYEMDSEAFTCMLISAE